MFCRLWWLWISWLALSISLFFFLNPQRKKGRGGREWRKKGDVKKFSYLRKFQLIMLWKIAGEKIRLFNTLQERFSLWDVCILSLAWDSFYTLMILAAVLCKNVPFCRMCNAPYLLDNVRILLYLLSGTSKHFISVEVWQRVLMNVNCYYTHFPNGKAEAQRARLDGGCDEVPEVLASSPTI